MLEESRIKKVVKRKFQKNKNSLKLSPINLYDMSDSFIVEREVFKDIVDSFFLLLSHALIQTGSVWIPPRGMGKICIHQFSTDSESKIDFRLFNKTGVIKLGNHNHYGRKYAMLKWHKPYNYNNVKFTKTISFEAVRYFKNQLRNYIRERGLEHYMGLIKKKTTWEKLLKGHNFKKQQIKNKYNAN